MPEHIDAIGREAIAYFTLKHAARERALPKSRTAIRHCANSIRATHRHETAAAAALIAQAASLLAEMEADLRDHQDIYNAGFVQDAQKETRGSSHFCSTHAAASIANSRRTFYRVCRLPQRHR